MNEMNETCHDIVLAGVTDIHILKKEYGYRLRAGMGQSILLAGVTNFEWRVTQGFPAPLTRLYAGSESGDMEEFVLHAQFGAPCTVRISNPDARCYLYIGPGAE